MPLKVKNSAEFGRMIAALAGDIVTASIHLQLLQDLNRSRRKYVRALSQSPAFWQNTFQAHGHTAMFALCRAYDSHDDSVNLKNMIEVARDHPEWFSEAEFRVRKKDSPHLKSLAEVKRTPDRRKVRYHLAFCGSPLVLRLQHWRHQAVAHKSRAVALSPEAVVARFPVSFRNMQTLTKRAARMVNYYSNLYDANTYSMQMFGNNDYRKVLEVIHRDIERHEVAFTAELRRAGYTRSGKPIARRKKTN